MPMYAVMSSLIGLCGLVMYAVYAECDPLLNGDIERMDQVWVETPYVDNGSTEIF